MCVCVCVCVCVRGGGGGWVFYCFDSIENSTFDILGTSGEINVACLWFEQIVNFVF